MKANELPEGWSELKLGELIDGIEAGLSFKCIEQPPQGDAPGLVKISAVTWGRFQETESKTIPNGIPPAENLRIRPGDLLISRANTIELVGACVLVENVSKQLFLSDKVLRIKISCENKRWLLYFLRSPSGRRQIELASSGNQLSMRNLSQDGLRSVKVPVPPLAEQKRIAEKLEAVLGRVDACRSRLDRVPALLKRFRQSVLAAATSGQLTEDWRESNKNLESAESLIKDQTLSITETENELPAVPDSWKWVALGDYAQCFRGRFSPRPRNDPRYFNGEHAFIQIGDLPREGGLVSSHIQTLNCEGLAVSRKFPKGTVVVAIVGATIGNTGILAYAMCATDSIVGIETGNEFGNQYVELFLRSQKEAIRQISYASGGQPNINLATLNPYPLPLPPLPEQAEIVRRVEALFAMVDRIEARLSSAQKTVERLTPAVLAKAFRGQLVPQDPTDEPAEALLARLAAQNQPTSRSAKKSKK